MMDYKINNLIFTKLRSATPNYAIKRSMALIYAILFYPNQSTTTTYINSSCILIPSTMSFIYYSQLNIILIKYQPTSNHNLTSF